jgi:hypothetical protein
MQQANKNEVRKEIAALIDQIKQQSDRIGMQREIPQQELDVILHRIEDLHRKTVVWSYLNTLPETPEEKPQVEPVSDVILTPEVPVQTEKQPEVEELKTESVPEVEVSNAEPVKPVVTQPEVVLNTAPQKELKDIRTFIGFNEKLMYIRQCFSGDADAYNTAIEQLNSVASETEAQAILMVASKQHNWNKENEAVQIFFQTVKRRFN